MSEGARVQRVAVIADFKAALRQFEEEVRSALDAIDLEIRRLLDWIKHDRVEYWRMQLRKRDDAVVQAKQDFFRCQSIPMPGGGTPACRDEKLALVAAQRRLEEAEDKVRAVRRWATTIQHEVTEYQGRAGQIAFCLDAELSKAVAELDRAGGALEAYLGTGVGPAAAPMSNAGTGSSASPEPETAPPEPEQDDAKPPIV